MEKKLPKNSFKENSIVKTLSYPLNYNQEAKNIGFDGDGEGIRIAILSTGLADHVIIKNISHSISFTNSETIDDTIGQSTFMAGIIGADDEFSLTGVAPKSMMHFVKISDDKGKVNTDCIVSGILWSIIKKVDVILLPILIEEEHNGLHEVVKKAYKNRIPIICPAGLKGINQYPSFYPETLTVGSLSDGNLTNSSADGKVNYENTFVSTHLKQHFASSTGDMCSVAFVGGIAALAIAKKEKTVSIDEIYKEMILKLNKEK